jgi:hypothetical protein
MTRFTTLTVAAATALGLGALAAAPAVASVLTPPIPVAQNTGKDCAAGSVVRVGTRHGNQDECAAKSVVPVGSRHG